MFLVKIQANIPVGMNIIMLPKIFESIIPVIPNFEYCSRKSLNGTKLYERGNSFGYNNLVVDFRNIPDMLNFSKTVIMDCTHSVQRPGAGNGVTGGNREFIPAMALAAKAFGATGYFFEIHPNPDAALSDGTNMLPLNLFENVLKSLL
mgnify:CR=1 FL=1